MIEKMRRFLLFFLLVFINKAIFAQYKLEYDFSKNKFLPNNNKLKNNEDINVKLLKFNPFIFTYSISTKTATYNSEIPNLLKTAEGKALTFEELLNKITTFNKNIEIRKVNSDSLIIKEINSIIWDIESSFFKFYKPSYEFKESDRIPESKLLKIEKLIKDLIEKNRFVDTSKLFYEKLKSYYLFNSYFRKEIFEKEIVIPKVDADRIDINIVVKPIKSEVSILGESLSQSIFSKDSVKLSLPIQRKNGYFSYSTGLFISNLNNPSYYIIADSIDIEEGSRNSFGYNALAHYMWDLEKLSLGFNLGLGVPIKKGKLATLGLFGVSAGIGKKNRVLLNVGTSVGMINAISKNNFKDALKKPVKSDIKEVITYSKLKAGFAFTINFNLNK